MAPTCTPDRQTFRALVADVAARAKARLPEAVNGRVEAAARLVLLYDVTPQEDGTILVGSSTDPLKTYHLVGETCECQDWQHGKAPEGWCQHRIAAGISKRVREVLDAQTAEEPGEVPCDAKGPQVHRDPDTPPALPEAPSSANVRIQLHGYDVQITLRDHSEEALLARLERLLQRYPMPQASSSSQDRSEGYCLVHNCVMQENHKDGRSWYSHRTPEGWCQGRIKGH